MKIKKETLAVKSTRSESEERLHNNPTNKSEHNLQSPVMLGEETVQPLHVAISDSVSNTSNDSQVTSVSTSQSCSTVSSSTGPWHHSGILRQALLSVVSSGNVEKAETNLNEASVLPKMPDPLLPSVDGIKLAEVLPPVSESVSDNSLSHTSFSSDRSFTTSITSLPPVSSPFGSLSFESLPDTSMTTGCSGIAQDSQSALPLMTQMETCDLSESGLQNSSSDVIPCSSGDTISNGDVSSSVPTVTSDISTPLVPVVSSYATSHLCQASPSSKDDAVTVVYSSVPKLPYLIHSMQKTVPLPSMSEVKSSLTNHLNTLPQTHNKTVDNEIHNKVSTPLPSISAKSNTHQGSLEFSNIPATEVTDTISTIKLDGNSNSSEFGSNSALSLPNGSVKFTSESSSSDLSSSIVIPVSSDVILTKIDGQNTVSTQDISHIITIPLATGTIYNNSLSIPMPLSLCNGNTSGRSSQVIPAVVPNMPYSITGISNQGSNSCWPSSAVALSVTSNTHQATSVRTSLPVSIMSVTSAVSSVPGSNMLHFTSNSVSAPSPTPATSTTINTGSQDPVCYTVQSPAEILSQLSKAGALPTMSSSQVSSVLSALGSDTSVDMEAESAHQNELLNNQVLHVDKVSTLTQTDTLEMNIMQNDEKIIQLLGGPQLLEQMSPRSLVPSISTAASPLETSINSSDLVTADITEAKQSTASFPRIVAMVLNTSAVNGNEKLPVSNVQAVEQTFFKSNQIRIMNNIVKPRSVQLLENTSDSLSNFLVLPNNTKSRKKRPKRMSALREMLLGLSESTGEKEQQSKKPRGRAKKTKSDSVDNICVSELKNYTNQSEEIHWNGNNRSSNYTKEATCYKCTYCPFISLEENSMVVHVKEKHSCEVSEVSVVRQELKCPGCPNVFFTTNSLEVHLKQDHQVNTPELKAITSSAIKTATEGKLKQVHQNHKRKKVEKKKSCSNSEIKDVSSINSPPLSGIPEILTSAATNNVSVIDVSGSLVINPNSDSSEMILNEVNKVRVRDLSNDTEVSKDKNETIIDNNENDCNAITPVLESTEHITYSELPVETIVMGAEQVSPVKVEVAVVGKVQPVEGGKRKRGRPKGSKTLTGTKTDKDGNRNAAKKNGHRCNLDNCAVTMRSPENIEYHRSCHSDSEFRCPECNHTHVHWDGMSIHLWRAHMLDMELYTCDQCNYKTNSYAKLINLHKWIHGSERPFLCDSCGKGFKNRKQLRNHKAVHQPKQTKFGECEVCGRTFTNKRLLRMHLDNVHNKLRPHLCNYCGYSASSVSSLKMHMRKHTGEKPFRCQLCDYCTSDHNSLRRHKMRHTGDKPYKCPHCPYACIQSSTYKAHLKTKHPGMDDGLMFSCSLCSFRSVKEENYIAHLSEHKRDVSTSEKQTDVNNQMDEADNPDEQTEVVPAVVSVSSQISSFSSTEAAEDGFDLGVQSNSVLHLVVSNENTEEYSLVKLDSMYTTPDVQMALESDFEAEEITGDLPEAELITGDINEPQEFKVCEDELKMKTHEDSTML